MLRDSSVADKKPYSFSKVQLAFWLIIILSAFVTIIFCIGDHNIPTFANSTLIILGISTGTLTAGRIIDVSDQSNPLTDRSQDYNGQNFLLDILSDAGGVSLHRLQCFFFNLIIGGWMSYKVMLSLAVATTNSKFNIDGIIPDISANNLVLMGISAGTYIALKSNENKPATNLPPIIAQSAIKIPNNTTIATTITSVADQVLPKQLVSLANPVIQSILKGSDITEFIKDEQSNLSNPAAG